LTALIGDKRKAKKERSILDETNLMQSPKMVRKVGRNSKPWWGEFRGKTGTTAGKKKNRPKGMRRGNSGGKRGPTPGNEPLGASRGLIDQSWEIKDGTRGA